MEAYCFRCREKRPMVKPMEKRHTKHGRYLYIGKCARCGGGLSKLRQEARNKDKKIGGAII